MKEIFLKEKTNYGIIFLYPNCTDSQLFAKLLSKKTLNYTDVNNIELLGYKVNIQKI
jgi:hypothetical protein